jgi:hypothetical protein
MEIGEVNFRNFAGVKKFLNKSDSFNRVGNAPRIGGVAKNTRGIAHAVKRL